MGNKSLLLAFGVVVCCLSFAEEQWTNVFNGQSLDGWTPKVKGSLLGENPGNIFRVEDGMLSISYDEFEEFGGRFGHLFIDRPLTNYRFRCEYRFVGEQISKGPGWAYRNNGIMVCCKAPEMMKLKQSFPECIEIQLLGAFEDGKARTTGNLLPLKNSIDVNGETTTRDVPGCPSLPLGEWVESETVVSNGVIQQYINGTLTFEASNPRSKTDGASMASGYLALQAESHPTQFRKLELLELD